MDRKFAKIRRKGSYLLHNDIIFGQLIEAHLKMLFLSLKKGFDRLLNRKKNISTSNCLSRKRNKNISILKIRGLILDSISQCFRKNRGVFEPENT